MPERTATLLPANLLARHSMARLYRRAAEEPHAPFAVPRAASVLRCGPALLADNAPFVLASASATGDAQLHGWRAMHCGGHGSVGPVPALNQIAAGPHCPEGYSCTSPHGASLRPPTRIPVQQRDDPA